MGLRRFRLRRWWHALGVGLFILCWGALPVLMPRITLVAAPWANAFVLALAGLPIAWGLVVCPWLDSSDPRFSDRDPPSSRCRQMIVFAWTPLAVLSLLIAALLVLSMSQSWNAGRFVPLDTLRAWWLWVGVGVLAVHGFTFARLLTRRTAHAARHVRICFNCAYSLAEIPNCERCPECGLAVDGIEA